MDALTPPQNRAVRLAMQLGQAVKVVEAARQECTFNHRSDYPGGPPCNCALCVAVAAYDGLTVPAPTPDDPDAPQGEFPPLPAGPCYGNHLPGRDGTCVRCEDVIQP